MLAQQPMLAMPAIPGRRPSPRAQHSERPQPSERMLRILPRGPQAPPAGGAHKAW